MHLDSRSNDGKITADAHGVGISEFY